MSTMSEPMTHAIMTEEPEGDDKRGLGFAGWLSIGWLALIFGTALLAPILPLKDPNQALADVPRLAPFQGEFLFGADGNGRDVLSRLIFGARTSLTIAVCAVLIGFLVGGLLGLLGGYFRNWIGVALSSLFDILLAIPGLVLALALVAVLKGDPSLDEGFRLSPTMILVIALGIVSIPLLARIARANTMAWAQREFVTAARAQGATHTRILFREIFPNVLPAMLYIALLGVAIAIVVEGGLAILGASVDPPTPSWGVMVESSRSEMRDAPFLMYFPILFIFMTVMSLNHLGDLVRERFDVRESAL